MVLAYATLTDLSEIDTGELTDPELTGMIKAASGLVRRATRTCLYDTTPTGAPSDDGVADAFRDAVVAQVEAWILLDVTPSTGRAGVQAGAKTGTSLLSGSVTYETRAGAADDKADTIGQLVPLAYDCLIDVDGLVWSQPVTY